MGRVNQSFDSREFDRLHTRVSAYSEQPRIVCQDLNVGADPGYRMPQSCHQREPWHALFARTMFIRPSEMSELEDIIPEFTILHAPYMNADPERDGTDETFIVVNLRSGSS